MFDFDLTIADRVAAYNLNALFYSVSTMWPKCCKQNSVSTRRNENVHNAPLRAASYEAYGNYYAG